MKIKVTPRGRRRLHLVAAWWRENVVDDAADLIIVHTVWGARRGRPPKL